MLRTARSLARSTGIGLARPFVRSLTVALAVSFSAGGLSAAPLHAPWARDLAPAAGAALLESVRADLAAIVRAAPSERGALLDAFAATKAAPAIEALKRFRNPELLPLFHALLRHADWHVVHRALLALERCEDGTALPLAWSLLDHPEPRVREAAAIACVLLWDAPGAVAPTDATAGMASRVRAERDAHVRAAFEALSRRAAGSRVALEVADEVRVTGEDGLVWTPLLRKMSRAKDVVPAFEPRPVARLSDRSASTLPVAARWTFPLLHFGDEELPSGFGLQPFGFVRNAGTTFHTGQDVGGFLDGAGLYACAEGIVRFVHTGSDMGTLIVVEHRLDERTLVTVLYMHAAGVVFAHAGDRVAAGQLLGSMGLGFSFENGGHFAHLHLGVYPGPFSPGHNYGYHGVERGLSDWYDPAVALAEWVDATRPLVEDDMPVVSSLSPVAALLRDANYPGALASLDATLRGAPGASALDARARADARRVRAAIVRAGADVVARAIARRESGYPSSARAILSRAAPQLVGVPDGGGVSSMLDAWEDDPAFRRDLDAEARFARALDDERGLRLRNDAGAVTALWERLQDECAGTCVAMRVQAKVAESVAK